MRIGTLACAGALAVSAAAPATAGGLDEIRIGAVAHDLTEHAEDGPQITIEALFDSPGFLDWAWSPKPYLYGSFNTQGFTNLGAAGLAWQVEPVDRLRFEASFGISYNDGVDDVTELDPGDPVRIRLAETRALLGSHWLFRSQFGADVAVTERIAVGVYYEHFSHGQILASGRNQGLDELGGRIAWRFGG